VSHHIKGETGGTKKADTTSTKTAPAKGGSKSTPKK
jgi:hypothetical protein